ncbi:MAG: OmpW family protein [Proteobacteria bacterium]|nr:OmpW family protein [Pseudomonadota bacterium]
MRTLAKIAAALLLGCALTSPALADDAAPMADTGVAGHFQVRLRGLGVIPDPNIDVKIGGTSIGGTYSVTDSFVPEIDGTYFLTDHIGLELIAATTQHSVHSSVAGNIGSVWLLPPTLTVQYHFDPTGPIRPYAGLGVNYTFFYSPKSPLPGIHYDDNFGFALQAGVDVPVGDGPYFLNFDVKKIFLSTHVTAAAGVVQASADLDPWIIGAGVGIRF